MCVYDRDDVDLFSRALDSVYKNTLVPAEVIVVQDGHIRKQLADVIRRYDESPIFHSLALPINQGLAVSLNKGLKLIKSEYVIRADADDYNLPDRFEKQMAMLEGGLDLVGGAIQEVDKLRRNIGIRRLPSDAKAIRRFCKTRNPFNHMTVAYRTQLAQDCGGYPNLHLMEDYGLWALMLSRGAKVANTNDILVEATTGHEMYRRRGGWQYARSEFQLQKHLINCDIKSLPEAVLTGLLRASVFMMPARLRGIIYESFLRQGEKKKI